MARVLKDRARDERGVSVVTVLAIAAAVFAAGGAIVQVALHQVQGSTFDRRREQAFAAAEAGVSAAEARLAGDAAAGWTISGTMPDGSAGYTVTVTEVEETADPSDRRITATGAAPAAVPLAQRRVEEIVALRPADGFAFALLAGPGGLLVDGGDSDAGEPLSIDGSLYSGAALDLPADTAVQGDVIAAGPVTTRARSLIAGALRSGGSVAVADGTTAVQGGVVAGGDVDVVGSVAGDVVAGGTIGGPGTIAGGSAPDANPPAPGAWAVPAYQPAAFVPTVTYATAGGEVDLGCAELAGASRIRVTGNGLTVIAGPCTLGGGDEPVVVADGPVRLEGIFDTVAGAPASLAVITPTGSPIEATAGTRVDPAITTLLLAQGGTVSFTGSGPATKLAGAVYGSTVDVAHEVSLAWAPVPAAVAQLFSFDGAAPARYTVVPQQFRELPAA